MTTDTVFGTESWEEQDREKTTVEKKQTKGERETGGESGEGKEGRDVESWIRGEEGAKRQRGPLFIHY